MSSSANPGRSSPVASTAAGGHQPEVLPFIYRELALPTSAGDSLRARNPAPDRGISEASALAAGVLEREAQLQESGRQQAEAELRAKFEEQLTRERSAVAKALAYFSRDCAGYYRRLEEEAVRLALSIARKILHREAQVDPLLLMGIVRVALERIEGATEVSLLVNPQQAADWRQQLASLMPAGKLPEIVEDPAMALDQCGLRTSMGTAEIGLEPQLKEIEQGLTDLLAARPKEKSRDDKDCGQP